MNQRLLFRQSLIAAGLALQCIGSAAAQQNSPSPPASVDGILSHMAANTSGIQDYDVPVNVRLTVKKGISVSLTLTGERYFAAPDKEALKLNGVPAVAKAFSNVYASLGTPATWPQTYNLQLVGSNATLGQSSYELRGTYKRQSTVDHILLDVNARTYDPIQVRWFYRNGATIDMTIQEEAVGSYRLPSVETVDAQFPGYRGHAVVDYGAYNVGANFPNSVFAP